MKQVSYDPGPWNAVRAQDKWFVLEEPFGTIVANQCNENNARLIAAAPDLLEALEYLVKRCIREDVPWAEEIDARIAIARAKGETK